MVPVGIDSISGPDGADVGAAIWVFEEDIILGTAGISIVSRYV
jgi:hypothetical protein